MPDQAAPAAQPNALAQIYNAFQGSKTHIAAGVGIVAILLVHFGHVSIPGVQINDADWLTNIWKLAGIMAGRSAVAKLQSGMSALGVNDLQTFLRAAKIIIEATEAQKGK